MAQPFTYKRTLRLYQPEAQRCSNGIYVQSALHISYTARGNLQVYEVACRPRDRRRSIYIRSRLARRRTSTVFSGTPKVETIYATVLQILAAFS
jgi:hypothetical protein